MKVKETKQMVETIVKTYIANDGQEFKSESRCKEHDDQLELEELFKKIKPLMIYENDYVPFDGDENNYNHLYRWFKVERQKELDKINDYYNTCIRVKNFPEYINIVQYDEMDFDCFGTTLTDCKEYVTSFFGEGFGIKVKFE